MARFPKPLPNPAVRGSENPADREFEDTDEKTDPEIALPPPPATPGGESPTVIAAGPRVQTPPVNPLQHLMRDPTITEIMVNDVRKIFVEREGVLLETTHRFESIEQLNRTVQSLLEGTGRILSYDQPFTDFRLADGSRVTMAIPPITLQGPSISIRRFSKAFGVDDWVKGQVLPQEAADFLRQLVLKKKNILISGGTSTGKTTLLNQLIDAIPRGERLVVIEETAEVLVPHANTVRLQPKSASPTSPGVTERDLVALALRMRPDRILMGEIRRSEALDLLLAMNTGHEGSMSTLHANSPRDALARMESLCLLAGVQLPVSVIRKHIARAIDYLVQLTRTRGGLRRVHAIVQITGMEGDVITTQDLWTYDDSTAVLRPTGLTPQS